jgi:hypothetical protein
VNDDVDDGVDGVDGDDNTNTNTNNTNTNNQNNDSCIKDSDECDDNNHSHDRCIKEFRCSVSTLLKTKHHIKNNCNGSTVKDARVINYPKSCLKKLTSKTWRVDDRNSYDVELNKSIFTLQRYIAFILHNYGDDVSGILCDVNIDDDDDGNNDWCDSADNTDNGVNGDNSGNGLGQLFASASNRDLIYTTIRRFLTQRDRNGDVNVRDEGKYTLIEPCCGHGHLLKFASGSDSGSDSDSDSDHTTMSQYISDIVINDIDVRCVNKTYADLLNDDSSMSTYSDKNVHKCAVDSKVGSIPLPAHVANGRKIVVTGPPYGTHDNRTLPEDIITNLLNTISNVVIAVFILPLRCNNVTEVEGWIVENIVEGVDDCFHKLIKGEEYRVVRQPTFIRVYKKKQGV